MGIGPMSSEVTLHVVLVATFPVKTAISWLP